MRIKQPQQPTMPTLSAPVSQPISAPTITLYPAQVAAVASYLLANPAIAHAHGLAPAEAGESLPDKSETCTYHLGGEVSTGRGYDDRLTVRLGLSRPTILTQLNLWRDYSGKRGGLRHICAGNKYVVSELAVREYLGDITR